MKLRTILLRWYKSFNISYRPYADRHDGAKQRPWNSLGNERFNEAYPFVEIPVEGDITTIVGANESGKSHLLAAIHKVLTGYGIPENEPFGRTDLCRYASVSSQNADIWPYLGLEFEGTEQEITDIYSRAQVNGTEKTFALILGPEIDCDEVARYCQELWIGNFLQTADSPAQAAIVSSS